MRVLVGVAAVPAEALSATNAGRFVCSWSGGKDSALGFALAVEQGLEPAALLSMLTEEGVRSRSHGLRRDVLAAQADALGLPLHVRATSWDAYTETFTAALAELAAEASHCVFGDIFDDDHLAWCRRVCEDAGVTPVHPLWGRPSRHVVDDVVRRGIEAVVVVSRVDALGSELLGRVLDGELASYVSARGFDPAGERGEYHTLVTAMPGFRAPLAVEAGERVLRSGCVALDVALRGPRFPRRRSAPLH